MAAVGGPMKNLCDETTCPICLEYFTEPITLDCGHNFCLACITQCWLDSDTDASCPQCRGTIQPRDFRPNRQLANVVELVKQLSFQVAKGADGTGRVCERHGEPLKLFCEEDDSPVCVVCDKSNEHRDHKVIPVEEAFRGYQEQIEAQLQSLEQEREKLLVLKLVGEQRSPECLASIEAEKQKVLFKLDQTYTFFDERHQLVVAQLSELKNKIEKGQKENATKLSGEISSLSNLIAEIEVKCQQSPSEFLQNIRSTLHRYKKMQVKQPIDPFPELEKKLKTYSHTTIVLVTKLLRKQTAALETFKESLEQALNKVNVTLDPDTASPYLVLSKDLKSVCWGDRWQKLPYYPERFDFVPCVLGREGFASGRHWWEVVVEVVEEARRGSWAVGVATEAVRRKDLNEISPDEEIWAVGNSVHAGPLAFTSSKRVVLTLSCEPRKIQVYLDYEGRQVKFTNADTDDIIFIFHSASFCMERIRPFFWVGKGFKMNC